LGTALVRTHRPIDSTEISKKLFNESPQHPVAVIPVVPVIPVLPYICSPEGGCCALPDDGGGNVVAEPCWDDILGARQQRTIPATSATHLAAEIPIDLLTARGLEYTPLEKSFGRDSVTFDLSLLLFI